MSEPARGPGLSPEFLERAKATIIDPKTTPYKRAYWRLALSLGRLPTTRDKAYWELPSKRAGEP